MLGDKVALRKESVDRNEIALPVTLSRAVALRKESVDRNCFLLCRYGLASRSLSARRAWIEIEILRQPCARNTGRSPQGERG